MGACGGNRQAVGEIRWKIAWIQGCLQADGVGVGTIVSPPAG